MNRIGRIELGAAVAGLALALAASVFLVVTTFADNESCYGLSGTKVVCQHLNTPQDAAQAAARIVVVLGIVIVLYVGSTLAAWWQQRASESSARWTAYMTHVTCAVTVLAITLPTIEGTGFFFLPGTLLVVASAILGIFALLQANRSSSVGQA